MTSRGDASDAAGFGEIIGTFIRALCFPFCLRSAPGGSFFFFFFPFRKMSCQRRESGIDTGLG